MNRLRMWVGFSMLSCLVGVACIGCTKKPSQEEVAKLDEARGAAESAERKLAELRLERTKLEQELQGKQSNYSDLESQRDQKKAK